MMIKRWTWQNNGWGAPSNRDDNYIVRYKNIIQAQSPHTHVNHQTLDMSAKPVILIYTITQVVFESWIDLSRVMLLAMGHTSQHNGQWAIAPTLKCHGSQALNFMCCFMLFR